jgi:hypothetical protein
MAANALQLKLLDIEKWSTYMGRIVFQMGTGM